MAVGDIAEAATAFVHSYAKAMALSSPTSPHSADIPFIAAAVYAHYANTTAFALGHHRILTLQDTVSRLEKFDRSGLGYDITMTAHRVESISTSSAICRVTWAIRPREACGIEGWQWENVYAYRRAFDPSGTTVENASRESIGREGEGGWEKPEGWWEFVVTDNEVLGILEKVPNFLVL